MDKQVTDCARGASGVHIYDYAVGDKLQVHGCYLGQLDRLVFICSDLNTDIKGEVFELFPDDIIYELVPECNKNYERDYD